MDERYKELARQAHEHCEAQLLAEMQRQVAMEFLQMIEGTFRCDICGVNGLGKCDHWEECSCGWVMQVGKACDNPQTNDCSLKVKYRTRERLNGSSGSLQFHSQTRAPVALQRISCTELDLLRSLDHERLLLFDIEGNLLHVADGNRYEVGIPTEVFRRLAPAASSHNHLWELAHSHGDIATAIASDLLEACIVGPNHVYRLTRPETGWPKLHVAEDVLMRAWMYERGIVGEGDPRAERLLQRRTYEQARGCYADPTDEREVVAWATCYLGVVDEFSSVFGAPFVIQLLP